VRWATLARHAAVGDHEQAGSAIAAEPVWPLRAHPTVPVVSGCPVATVASRDRAGRACGPSQQVRAADCQSHCCWTLLPIPPRSLPASLCRRPSQRWEKAVERARQHAGQSLRRPARPRRRRLVKPAGLRVPLGKWPRSMLPLQPVRCVASTRWAASASWPAVAKPPSRIS